jgi:hypothetical protein
MTADPAFLVNDRGEKLLRKMADRGRVFAEVNDADYVEHPLLIAGDVDSDRWKYYRGSRATAAADTTMGSATGLTQNQEDIFSVARSSILDTASNFVVPQDIVKRPVQKQLDTIEALMKRHMNLFFREQESYLVLGGSTPSATPTVLSPHLTDDTFSGYGTPSFSLLGLMIDGISIAQNDSSHTNLSGNKFMGVLGSEAEWSPYIDSYDDAVTPKIAYNNNSGQDVYEALQDYIIQVARYGPGEQVTDWLVTPAMYGEVLKYLRSISRTNDELISNLATTTEIPVAGTMFDFHHYLAPSVSWDVSTNSAVDVATHPIIGLNMDSLRLNLVYGGDVESSWLTPVSDFQPFQTASNLFKRLHARSCFSIDNGRRSFVYSDKFKDA